MIIILKYGATKIIINIMFIFTFFILFVTSSTYVDLQKLVTALWDIYKCGIVGKL